MDARVGPSAALPEDTQVVYCVRFARFVEAPGMPGLPPACVQRLGVPVSERRLSWYV